MADAKKSDSADTADQAFADRGADTGLGAGAGSNALVADASASPADALAYRTKGDNLNKRIEHIERWVIEMGYGGDVRRFDAAAGLDANA